MIEKVGMDMLPGFTAPKILWLKRNEPENFARLATVLLPHDYLNFYLTGHLRMEYGDASGTALMDVRTRTWARDVLDFIDPALAEKMPALGSSREPAGTLLKCELSLDGPAYNLALHTLPVQESSRRLLPLAYRVRPQADQHGGLRVGHGLLYKSHAAGGERAVFARGRRSRRGAARKVSNSNRRDGSQPGIERAARPRSHRHSEAVEDGVPPVLQVGGSLPHMVRALRHRDFRLFWGGNFLSNIGTWMQNVAMGWLVLQLAPSHAAFGWA